MEGCQHQVEVARRVALIVNIGLWLAVGAASALSALPANPLDRVLPSAIVSAQSEVWAPQGWAFFTRDPREEMWLLYTSATGEGDWISAKAGPNARARFVFGLNREPRAQGVEVGLLLSEVSEEQYTDCEEQHDQECLEKAIGGSRTVGNDSPVATLCGHVGVVMREPVPWAWAGSQHPEETAARAVVLEVECQNA